MKSGTKTKHTPILVAVSAIAALSFLTSGTASAKAGKVSSPAACAAEMAASDAVTESLNGAGDAVGDALDLAGLPVGDAGLQEQGNQENANLANIEAEEVPIETSVCQINQTLSTPPGPTADMSLTLGKDTEPDVAAIPTQVNGNTGVAASPMAGAVDVDNTKEVTTLEAKSVVDLQGALIKNEMNGPENMQGIALTNIEADKATLKQEDTMNEKLKASANMKDLLANEGYIQIAAVDALNRIDESVNQLAANQAQDELNKADEKKIQQDDHLSTAKIFAAAGAGAIDGAAIAGSVTSN